jgi:putative phosphoribosyl transferase
MKSPSQAEDRFAQPPERRRQRGGIGSSRSRTFTDRRSAGVLLAHAMLSKRLYPPVIVLGLPRGGVPVASEVARALQAPLDVLTVRKIGAPGQPELAIGAIATGGIVVREPALTTSFAIPASVFDELARTEWLELARREAAYRHGVGPLDLDGRTVVLVDDGMATGTTMVAAIRSARKAGAARVIAAAPVASDEATALVGSEADEIVILRTPPWLGSVGEWYENFEQVEDTEVQQLLRLAHRSRSLHKFGSEAHE